MDVCAWKWEISGSTDTGRLFPGGTKPTGRPDPRDLMQMVPRFCLPGIGGELHFTLCLSVSFVSIKHTSTLIGREGTFLTGVRNWIMETTRLIYKTC